MSKSVSGPEEEDEEDKKTPDSLPRLGQVQPQLVDISHEVTQSVLHGGLVLVVRHDLYLVLPLIVLMVLIKIVKVVLTYLTFT